jgi:hypothetical protein
MRLHAVFSEIYVVFSNWSRYGGRRAKIRGGEHKWRPANGGQAL